MIAERQITVFETEDGKQHASKAAAEGWLIGQEKLRRQEDAREAAASAAKALESAFRRHRCKADYERGKKNLMTQLQQGLLGSGHGSAYGLPSTAVALNPEEAVGALLDEWEHVRSMLDDAHALKLAAEI